MRSTNSFTALTLSYRRADVVGFWIVIAGISALSAGLVSAWLGAARPWMWSAGIPFALLLPGAVWTPWYSTAIRAWNSGVRRARAGLRAYVLAVCYGTVLVAVGRSGSSLDLEARSRGTSEWIPLTTDSHPSGHGIVAAARRRGSAWLIALVPTLFLLRLLDDDARDHAPSASTYTLY